MDLGIKGRLALVCASSQGLGLACATSLAREGVNVYINGRDPSRLELAQSNILKSTGILVNTIQADITKDSDRKKII